MNDQHFNLLKTGAEQWNAWRRRNPLEKPDLQGIQFDQANFDDFNLAETDFKRAILNNGSFIQSDLLGADFKDADLTGSNFRSANLRLTDFSDANLSRCNFYRSRCWGTIFQRSNLYAANFREMSIQEVVFANVDLATVIGMDQTIHQGASSISIDTLYRSEGNIPQVFLRHSGIPDVMIDYLPSLIQAGSPIQFHSCFISYSHVDEVFARNLWGKMKNERISVWYAKEDMKGGQILIEQIDRAIQHQDKLLIVLSKSSMQSNWVQSEIRRARKYERQTQTRKLFPIALADFPSIKAWECFDADTGKDLAAELREYYIPDFSQWRDESQFQKSFAKLCEDLRKAGVTGGRRVN